MPVARKWVAPNDRIWSSTESSTDDPDVISRKPSLRAIKPPTVAIQVSSPLG
jgi:hypothetical protein